VPMGFAYGLPVGLSFFGRAWSEPLLLKFAYAYEQATKHRKAPKFLPTAGLANTSEPSLEPGRESGNHRGAKGEP
jgi:amidase